MRRALLLALLAILLLPAAGAADDELLVNGGFESGLQGWTGAGQASGPCLPRGGSQALSLTLVPGVNPAVEQVVHTAAAGQYRLSGYAHSSPGGAQLRVRLVWRGPGGEELLTSQTNATLTTAYSAFALGPVSAPSGSAQVTVWLQPSGAPSTLVCLDDVSLQGPPAATATAAPSPSPSLTLTASATASPSASATPTPRTASATRPSSPTPATDRARFLNGGFEDGTVGWQKFGGELETVSTPRRGGRAAGALISSTSSTKWAFQVVAIDPDLAYEFAGHVWPWGAVEAAYLRLSWYASADGSGQALSFDDSPRRLEGESAGFEFLTTGPRRPPAGARSLRVRVMLAPAGAAFAALFLDDFSLEVSTPAPSPSPAATAVLTSSPATGPSPLAASSPTVVTQGPSAAAVAVTAGVATDVAMLPLGGEVTATPAPRPRDPSPPARSPATKPAAATEEQDRDAVSPWELGAFALCFLALLGGARWLQKRWLAGRLLARSRLPILFPKLSKHPAAAQRPLPDASRLYAPVIAIDGPVASGKTAVGLSLARELGYRLVDTGMMYRAVTWLALQRGVPLDDEEALTRLAEAAGIELDQPEAGRGPALRVDGADVTAQLRSPDVDRNVSLVSRMPGVRRAMVARQRQLAQEGRLIMLGRDIGSVVLTDAPVKIYLDASAPERARRRHRELAEAGIERDEQEILRELQQRDEMDRERHVSPLRPAPDALVIDTDGLSLEEVIARVREAAAGQP